MKKIFFLAILIFAYTNSTHAQLFNKKLNQYGEDKKRTGWWISYWDDEEKVPMSVARYKAGREVGVSKEYLHNGNIRLKFRYHKNRMRVKYYYSDGKLEQKGWAIMEYNEKDTHFYWHGKWKFFDKNRKLTRIAYYQNGEEVLK